MSKLPPALAARLAKRGILPNNDNKQQTKIGEHHHHQEEEEEVIAEDYDDIISNNKDDDDNRKEIISSKTIDTVIGCPNKYNIYHNCTNFCLKNYSDPCKIPNKRIRKLFIRLLKKYPIKDSVWQQVFDPGLQTFYFWNTETDQVSWLPPNHPDAKISISTEKLRHLMRNDNKNNNNNKESDNENESNDDNKDDSNDDSDDNDESENINNDDDDSDDDSDDSDDNLTEKLSTTTKRMRRMVENRNKLDPMDPASYSDIPRGKWSDGLR